MKKRYKGKWWNKKGKWYFKVEKIENDDTAMFCYYKQYKTRNTRNAGVIENGKIYEFNMPL